MNFLTALAWIFGVMSVFLIVLRIIGSITYSELDKLCDKLEGKIVTFPLLTPTVVAIICFTWILTGASK